MLRTFVVIPVLAALSLSLVGASEATPAPAAPSGSDAIDQVDVFTGTSNSRWMLFPGATRPFGLV